MPKTSEFAGIKHVVRLSTGESASCSHDGCKFKVMRDEFTDLLNHYLKDHAYVLLHVGTETTRDEKENPWQTTVAFLGSRVVPNAKRGRGVPSRKRIGVQPLKM